MSVEGLAERPKILYVHDADSESDVPADIRDSFDVVTVSDPQQAISRLCQHTYAGVYVSSGRFRDPTWIGRLLQNERILDAMPNGVVLLDAENNVLWANKQFSLWAETPETIGLNFYSVLTHPVMLGPDFCPFHTAMATFQPSSSTLRVGDSHFFQVHAAPVREGKQLPKHLVVTVRDVTEEVLQKHKMEAIHKAGIELAQLKPTEIFDMEVDERIELLKSNILHHTQDLLNFDVVEIRLLDQETGQLISLLSTGLDEEACGRPLRASTQNNGVTGFVAATGKSYLCEDTAEDPLYLPGFQGAKSSLTVPLIWHEQVIGTFNVESPEPQAFTESDLLFLEIFCRDVAMSLNTLELLVAQKANTALESVEAIHSAVASPIDQILNDTVNVMEGYIGHETSVLERLQRILRNARDIKQVIQKVGRKMTPVQAVPISAQTLPHPKFQDCRVLVVDDNDEVRNDAHALLERYGCVVETAHEGGEAVYMVRNCPADAPYRVIIADIRLPDMAGNELFQRLKETTSFVPLVLMTGFGYDPGHTIVKARQAGLHPKAVLYKPFCLDQLLKTVEVMLDLEP